MFRLQKTYDNKDKTGNLFLIATPIGNLEDITLRALNTLKRVDYLLAEDTRVSKKLLKAFCIEKKIISFNEYNQDKKISNILNDLANGKEIGLISDAGMPGICDPSSYIIEVAIKNKINIIAVGGISSLCTSYMLSAFNSFKRSSFLFLGFLPNKKSSLVNTLNQAKEINLPFLFFQSPKRLIKTINIMLEIFPKESKICILKELTKIHESIIWSNLSQLKKINLENILNIKGEFTVVLKPYEDYELKEEIIQKAKDELKEEQLKSGSKILSKIQVKKIAQKYNIKANCLYKNLNSKIK